MARGGYRDTYDRDYQNNNANRGRGMLCDKLFVLITSNKLLQYYQQVLDISYAGNQSRGGQGGSGVVRFTYTTLGSWFVR